MLLSDVLLSCCLLTVLQNWSYESTGVITHPYWDASPPMPAALWYTWTTPWRRPVLTPLRCPAAAVSCQPLRPELVEKTLWWATKKKNSKRKKKKNHMRKRVQHDPHQPTNPHRTWLDGLGACLATSMTVSQQEKAHADLELARCGLMPFEGK